MSNDVIDWQKLTPYGRDMLISEKIFNWPDQLLMPHYSRNMSDAWLVVREMNKPLDGTYACYTRFVDELTKLVGSNLFFDLFYCDVEGDHLSPERICIAALRAVGCSIMVEGSAA